MNVRRALRSADPARRLPRQTLSRSDEQLLRTIVSVPLDPDPAQARRTPPRRPWKPLITTGVVTIVVLVVTVLAIGVIPGTAPAPATTTPTSIPNPVLEAVVDAKLAAAAGQQRLDPDLPSQTWTDDERGADGSATDLTGKTLYLAAACTGGGAVTIRIDGQLDTTVDCTTTAVIGPIDLTAIEAKAKKGLGLDITASEGRPEYFAKAVAVAGSDVTTTTSVDIDGRTLLIYPAAGAGGNQALLQGVLGQNEAGCITVGRTVIVAPSNIELRPDGALSLGSTTIKPGDRVELGGGVAASIPVGSRCRAATGEYFIVGDYPQPQSG